MPKRQDLHKILVVGSGPIVIGQACEFDYSGSQACKALREEGFEVVLVNSNPATIMTDPELAHRTYIEPITPEVVASIIARERPSALLPTLGGQTALNVTAELSRQGLLEQWGVEVLGGGFAAIQRAEDREAFKEVMAQAGVPTLHSAHVSNLEEAREFAGKTGYPLIIRPSYTLGGAGGGVAHDQQELESIVTRGLALSGIHQVLLEESVTGWKEIELELMRDHRDNVIVICSIENIDAMGVHTGDSITVAPAQTLTDKEYQQLRELSIRIMRAIGVEAGGSNIQFAVHPQTGRMAVIEMNPRVSRSSALASKATGFPIAKLAAKLAVGYTLDELPNDITCTTPASFEPALDYVVVKAPRWDFSKFPGSDQELTTFMKSVGEVMAIGRTFKEALQKALRSLEEDRYGWGADSTEIMEMAPLDRDKRREFLAHKLEVPGPRRLFYLYAALEEGFTPDEASDLSGIDPWFIYQLEQLRVLESRLRADYADEPGLPPSARLLAEAKRAGFSDRQLAYLWETTEQKVRDWRNGNNVRPVFKAVDTCAGEFEALTPYFYSTYESETEVPDPSPGTVIILGGGPNRIGQGIEFDYACVHAARALRDAGHPVVMVNCNPETVSTDYDTSDRLYFEPLTLEDVLHICRVEKPQGVIVQFGGQTPLKLAQDLLQAGVPILGTSPHNIDLAEDREKMSRLLSSLEVQQAPAGWARSPEEADRVAGTIGYPVLVRPSYVLGGRAMQIVYNSRELAAYMAEAARVSPHHPVLIDKFLDDALEIDVDALCDGQNVYVAGILEHIEQAGVHSGDSACVLPPRDLPPREEGIIRQVTESLGQSLQVVGLMNLQFAVRQGQVFLLEVNPRASRTVPFVSKATGLPLARLATRLMMGEKLPEMGLPERTPPYVSVKEAVLPFSRFPGVDVLLGPEMRSTGEVMGIASSFGLAFAKAQMAAGAPLPRQGTVLISAPEPDRVRLLPSATALVQLGFRLLATPETAAYLAEQGLPVQIAGEGPAQQTRVARLLANQQVDMLINTPGRSRDESPDRELRRLATERSIPIMTTVQGAAAAVAGISQLARTPLPVQPLQEYYRQDSLP